MADTAKRKGRQRQPKRNKQLNEGHVLETLIDMAEGQAKWWIAKQNLPWDFDEIRRKHRKNLKPAKRDTLQYLEDVFHRLRRAREYISQRNLEACALEMFLIGHSLGQAKVVIDLSRLRAAAKYKTNTNKGHELVW